MQKFIYMEIHALSQALLVSCMHFHVLGYINFTAVKSTKASLQQAFFRNSSETLLFSLPPTISNNCWKKGGSTFCA